MGGVLLLSKVSCDEGSGGLEDLTTGLMTVMGAALAGGVGALIGASSGGASEQWEHVPLTPPGAGRAAPTREHGSGIGATTTF
jgi:hypothetical protein